MVINCNFLARGCVVRDHSAQHPGHAGALARLCWLTRSMHTPILRVDKRGGPMNARTYAKVVGVVVVLIGIGGLALGEKSLLGVLNIDIAEDVVHLVSGGLMAFVGFRGSDSAVRSVVGGLGVVYLLVGLLGFIVPDLFGLLPHEYETVLDNLIHLTLGVLGIAIGFFVGDRAVDHAPRSQATESQ